MRSELPGHADAVVSPGVERSHPFVRYPVWIEALSHIDPAFGGVTAIVPNLARALRRNQQIDALVAPFCGRNEDKSFASCDQDTLTCWPESRSQWLHSGKLRAAFDGYIAKCNGVHIHGLWQACSAIASRAARTNGKPYIVSAHGMLEPWALSQGAFKKKIYSALVERPILKGARCLHALTFAEASDYRSFGCTAPIAIIPNAVERPNDVDPDQFLAAFPQLRNKRLLLFLGRLHRKKGVRLLLESWAQVRHDYSGTTLVLAGPSDNSDENLQQYLAQFGPSKDVIFTGMLSPEMKWSALACAHAFVLPSFSEGQSVATLEAVSMGVPTIVSKACNLPEIAAARAGLEIDPTLEALTTAIRGVLELSPELWEGMSLRAAALARAMFSWSVVGAQMSSLYDWALTGNKQSSLCLMEVN